MSESNLIKALLIKPSAKLHKNCSLIIVFFILSIFRVQLDESFRLLSRRGVMKILLVVSESFN